jgi:hypothetical protein
MNTLTKYIELQTLLCGRALADDDISSSVFIPVDTLFDKPLPINLPIIKTYSFSLTVPIQLSETNKIKTLDEFIQLFKSSGTHDQIKHSQRIVDIIINELIEMNPLIIKTKCFDEIPEGICVCKRVSRVVHV